MDGVWKTWFIVVVVYWCFCSIVRDRIAVESSHVIHANLQGSSPRFVDNTLRPRYHFRPPRHWINDPNAPLYYKGFYHLFYQYNPYGSVWGNIVWGHSISTDLINWKALDPAIYPTIPSDIYGCWSGSATILPGDKPVILYSGIISAEQEQAQNAAYPANLSDPYLREWIKPHYNPIMTAEKVGLNSSNFRDPTTAWYHPNGYWTLIIANKRDADNRGTAILYRSKDFIHWVKAKHPLHSVKDSDMWECLDFYPVASKGKRGLDTSAYGPGIKHVLKISLNVTRYDYYTLGTYYPRLEKYVPFNTSPDSRTGLRYDYGNFYASKTFYDPAKHRRILWGWANESDTAADDNKKGWAGIQLIPRSVWLHKTGRQLLQWPIEEFESLRQKHVSISNINVPAGASFEVKDMQTAQADVDITFIIPSLEKAEEFDPSYIDDAQAFCAKNTADVKGGVGPFGLYVLASSKLEEKTAAFFKIFKNGNKHVVLMCHDPTRSTKKENIYKPTFAGYVDVDLERAKKISLRTLIDHSVVESFGARGKTCISSRVYPSLAVGKDSHLFVFNNGAENVKVSEMNAWEIKSPEMNEEVIY